MAFAEMVTHWYLDGTTLCTVGYGSKNLFIQVINDAEDRKKFRKDFVLEGQPFDDVCPRCIIKGLVMNFYTTKQLVKEIK